MGGMGVGAIVSEMTQDERSNSMNSSAFSCGDRSDAASQPCGGAKPCVPNPRLLPWSLTVGLAPTCRSLKTARPQTFFDPTGVSKEKYKVGLLPGPPPAVPSL